MLVRRVCVCVTCRWIHGLSVDDVHVPRQMFTFSADPSPADPLFQPQIDGQTAAPQHPLQEMLRYPFGSAYPSRSFPGTVVSASHGPAAAVSAPPAVATPLTAAELRPVAAQVEQAVDGASVSVGGRDRPSGPEEAYASLLSELCHEVGVTHVSDLLPRVRQLCSASLMLPALDEFASTVCARLTEHAHLLVGGPVHPTREVSLAEAYDLLMAVLREVRLALVRA